MIIKAYTFATHPHGRRGFENLKPDHRGSECATVLADADHWIEIHGHGRIASDAARARALEAA